MKIEDLIQEWKSIFNKSGDFYIYGAALSAQKTFKGAQKTGVAEKIKGFVVTNIKENVTELEGLPVTDIHEVEDKMANILVYHKGYIKEDICCLLDNLGFHNVYLISKYAQHIWLETPREINDDYMSKAIQRKKELYEKKTVEEKKLDEVVCSQILEICEQGQPDFGWSKFYQSFERIGLEGIRPTLYRIEKYGIEQYLNKSQKVLDIGCNVGFIDMTIAPLVKSIIGVEYDETLVKVANHVRKYLQLENCEFVASDFCAWQRENVKKFDVIFSFAIHHWLNISAAEYVQIVDLLLNENGIFCFESHDIEVGDKKFEACVKLFFDKKFQLLEEGVICDEGLTNRKYVLLKKEI